MDEAEQGYSSKKSIWQWALLYLLIGGLIYGLVYYFVLAKNPSPVPSNSSVQNQPPVISEILPKEIKVEGNDFSFSPSEISFKQGEKVKVTFTNTGKFPHNLTSTDLNIVSKTIQAGESDTFEFTPEKTGSFSFVCTVGNHEERGMTGTMQVQ